MFLDKSFKSWSFLRLETVSYAYVVIHRTLSFRKQNMIAFLVHRPVAVLVSFAALLLLGAAAYTYLPTSLLPGSDIPEITVRLTGDHLSAEEMEERLTAPVRSQLLQLHGLEHIESRASEGRAVIRARFEDGTDISLRFIEVNEKVDMAMNSLPREASRPLVSKSGVDDIPIFNLNIALRDTAAGTEKLAEMSAFVRGVVRGRIEQLAEVSMVDATGMAQPQVRIEPKHGQMQSLGLDEQRLLRALGENKINLGNILVADGHYRYFLKFEGAIPSVSSLKATPISIGGRVLRLGEIAEVSIANEDGTGAFYSNGRRAVSLAVIKQSVARMEDLQKNFHDLLGRMRQDYPDLSFEISQDQTALLNYAIGNLRQDLWIGGALAALLMLVFIRRIRPGLLIGITMPMSLLISQMGFYLTGISINIISLGGLILGLGMIVDNSIVVIDNIQRHRDEGYGATEAAILGTTEIVRPLITSVLTNCAVFVPLIFMSGLVGAIFYDQALSVTIGVTASLVVAILLLPPLYKIIYSRRENGKSPREFEFKARVHVTGWYERGLMATFAHPVLSCLAVCAMLAGGVWLYATLDKERLPKVTTDDLEIAINWNEPIGVAENERRVADLLRAVDGLIAESSAWVGEQQYLMDRGKEQSPSQASVYVRAASGIRPDSLQIALQTHCRQRFPRAIMEARPGKNAFDEVFADRKPPLRLLVSARDSEDAPPPETVLALLDSLRRALPHAGFSPPALQKKILIRPDALQAARYGIGMDELAARIESAFRPTLVDHYPAAHELVPILLGSQRDNRTVDETLATTFIRKKNGLQTPLSALVETGSVRAYRHITAGANGRHYPLDIATERAGDDLKVVRELVGRAFPTLDIAYVGSHFDNHRLVGEMSVILLVSVLLLYFILAAQFESLLQPLFILAELPVALSGALFALYLAGSSINLMSMIGIVVMCGLIINDSILKLDTINRLRVQGVPLLEAIYQGGHKRIKPILMITLTSIGALAPTLFMDDIGSELQQPLALALIGGMTVGLLVSLFFVPLLYWMVYSTRSPLPRPSQRGCNGQQTARTPCPHREE